MIKVMPAAGLLLLYALPFLGFSASSPATSPTSTAAAVPAVVIAVNKDSQGLSITVKNNGRAAVTALLVSTQRRDSMRALRSENYRYVDVYVNRGTDAPLLSGDSMKMLLLPTGTEEPGSTYDVLFRGALFADGSSFGDQSAIDILSGRRRRLIDELNKAEIIVLRATKESWSHNVLGDHIRGLIDQRKVSAASRPSSRTESAISMMEPFVLTWLLNSFDSVDSGCQSCIAERIKSTGQDLIKWRNHLSGTLVAQ